MPYSIARKLKSVVQISIDPAIAPSIGVNTIKLSSAFDPTGAFGSGQPLGFDQYAALYNRYAVVGWSVKMEYVTTDNTAATVIGFCPVVSSTTLTQYEHYKELPGCVSRVVTPDTDRGVLFTRGSVRRYLLPRGAKMLADDTVTASVTADPTRMLHGHVFAAAMDNAADIQPIKVIITLTQLVVFFTPVVPARS